MVCCCCLAGFEYANKGVSNTVIKAAEFMQVGELARTAILDEPETAIETNETQAYRK